LDLLGNHVTPLAHGIDARQASHLCGGIVIGSVADGLDAPAADQVTLMLDAP
jgi:hypothetical protein